MKSRAKFIACTILPVALAAVWLALATDHPSAPPPPSAALPTPHHEEPWIFKEGRGILLSPSAHQAIGLRVEPVETASIEPESAPLSAQIYRDANESKDRKTASASLWLSSAQAAALTAGHCLPFHRGSAAFAANLTAVKPAFQPGGTRETLWHVEDPGRILQVGDFLEARLPQPQAAPRPSAVIPAAAVVESVRGAFVYTRNGPAYLRIPVRLGPRHSERIEVLDGLMEGDEIVTTGVYHLWMIELQAVNGGKGCADGH